ncbi:hemolysin [Sesbania bispinosa]|nr:hemolysin [Sesbania bispinosa]
MEASRKETGMEVLGFERPINDKREGLYESVRFPSLTFCFLCFGERIEMQEKSGARQEQVLFSMSNGEGSGD